MYQYDKDLDFHALGHEIKRKREAKGWTQEYLAQLVDRTPRSIMYMENRGQKPSLNVFYQLVTLLEISVDQFFFPDKLNGESTCRKQIDVMLNTMERTDILDRFNSTVDSLHIEKLIGKSLFALSGGEKQKIACASVNALMPDVFVLDEPTSNLDIGTIRDLQEILLSWKAQGKTVIIAEHRLAWLRNIVDRILFFQDGKIAEDMEASAFWKKQPAELHKMGLRAAYNFIPQCRKSISTRETLEFRDFHFSIKGTELLNIDHLNIPKGTCVAILGDNGAGKTTFARCICGLEKKSEGTLNYNGQTYSVKQRLRLCYLVMQDVKHRCTRGTNKIKKKC